MINVALDTNLLDSLRRAEDPTYAGPTKALEQLRELGRTRRIQVWVPEIAWVEMFHGIEKALGDEWKTGLGRARDARKKAIAEEMNARRLGYPCSKVDDTYSRIGMSFRAGGEHSRAANALEKLLRGIHGISPGDASHLVSCVFAFDGNDVAFRPRIEKFVTCDDPLIKAIRRERALGRLAELGDLVVDAVDPCVADLGKALLAEQDVR